MGFSFYRSLTCDHTQCGSSDSVNFPVLVSITDATLKDAAHGGHVQSSAGNDLLFFSDVLQTTQLKSEIEFYDNINGVLVAWVQVPTLSHTANTVFYLFYDNAAPPARTPNPWDSHYTCVLHFANGSVLSTLDSTTHADNGTQVNAVAAAAGLIDGGMSVPVSPSTGTVTFSPAKAMTTGQVAVTVEVWANAASFSIDNGVLLFESITGSSSTRFALAFSEVDAAHAKPELFARPQDGDGIQQWRSNTSLATGAWHHIVVVLDHLSATVTMYVDGAPVVFDITGTVDGATFTNTAPQTCVSGADATNAENYQGLIDELRKSTTVRDQSWATSSFNSQKSPSTFLAVGNETSTDPPIFLTCAVSDAEVGLPYSGSVIASGGTPPYTFAITAGALPPGLSLNTSTGVISGTPNQSGTFSFTAQVTDSLAESTSVMCRISIRDILTLAFKGQKVYQA